MVTRWTWLLLAAGVLAPSHAGHSTALSKRQREDPNIHLTDDSVVIEVSGMVRHRRDAEIREAEAKSQLDNSLLGEALLGESPPRVGPRQQRQFWRAVRPLPHAPCFTAAGQLGRCASFRECYPYFKAQSWGPFLFGSMDTCSYYNDQIRQPDVFQTLGVCCVSPVTLEGGGLDGPPMVAPVEAPPIAPALPEPSPVGRPALGSWPPPIPTHPPDHTAATHPPGFGVAGTAKPTQSTTKKPLSTSKKPQQTTWATKPTTTTKRSSSWPPVTQAPVATTTIQSDVLGDSVSPCGAKNGYQDQERIVGGHNAEPNEWPWIVALFNAGRQFCGGSLIDDQHILSAAHCVAHMTSWDVARVTARLGDHDIKTNNEVRHVEKRIKRVVRHRGFDMRTLYNDIAILTVDSPVHFTPQIRPVCLPFGASPYAGNTGTVIGWGSLRESGPQPGILQEVSLPIWTNNECKNKYGAAAPGGIVEHMLCAGRATKDSCSGDSGGPLMVNEGGRWTQVGVVSWGIGCGKGQYPGVYSRVSFFMPWIQKNSK